MRRPGLRARVTAGFAAGALALSASMALLSYELTRSSLLDERERTAVRAAYFDATVVHAGLSAEQPDVAEVLRSLDTGANRRAVLLYEGRWYGRNADAGTAPAVPESLRTLVASGQPGAQRIELDTGPAVAVGIPLSATAGFFEIDSLRELAHTLDILALVLTAVATALTSGGAGLGWYATRHVLRPLAQVADAAGDITAGDLKTRLPSSPDPDLDRLAVSFNQMVDRLAERLERDRRFAADVSHELRSPLQTLSAAVSVLSSRRDRLDERTATAAGLVADEVDRFQTLVTDLLELARSDQPADRGHVDVVALARRACRQRGLDEHLVTADPDAQDLWWVDGRRVEQVLGNLLDNARHHGGGPVAVHLSRHGRTGVMDVDDEGPGISPADREAVFDRFVRASAAGARRDSDGTGLGLAIVAQHAAAHEGTARVLDRPGGGARLRVEFGQALP
ncbi:HAMP domain-containing sensor histidine kinase [Longispora sp. NPDC051575]|uniref:sensor histidine kinase n=1 Tax=Longispora sp. NPDC051575 TaxID=3154943 RepID=UPI00343456D3